MDTKRLLQEESFHGYLPRLPTAKKYLVISVLVDPEGKLQKQNEDSWKKDPLVKTVIVRQADGNTLCVEGNRRFDNVGHMLCHYRNGIRIGNLSVPLRTPVKLAKWEYEHKDVTVGMAIFAGAFNDVCEGELMKKTGESVAVAIEMTKVSADATHNGDIYQLMREARIMLGLNHPNVVKMHGVAALEQPIYLLIEHVGGGSLEVYLKKNSGSIDREQKLKMSLGPARGLAYLHGEGLIHRDIAARNCYLDESKNVKIAGFGLSLQCTSYNIMAEEKLPTKWMAPESIQLLQFTQKTDVYSYGVLIYEIFVSKPPYEGQKNAVAKKNILDGKLSTFPASTPKELMGFVTERLWAKSHEERPSMQNVVSWLEKYTGFPNDESRHTAKK